MKDADTTVAVLRDKVRAFIAEREWEDFHHPRDLAISLSLEAAELLEHFQWEPHRPVAAIRKDGQLVAELSDELADILHYVLNFANVLDIDLAQAFDRKTKRNADKYPANHVRGKALRNRVVVNRKPTLTDDEL